MGKIQQALEECFNKLTGAETHLHDLDQRVGSVENLIARVDTELTQSTLNLGTRLAGVASSWAPGVPGGSAELPRVLRLSAGDTAGDCVSPSFREVLVVRLGVS